jgi:hypothetical protein
MEKSNSFNAKDLTITEFPLGEIYDIIKNVNEQGMVKTFIPHYKYVPNKSIMNLIQNGFHVYKGNWDANNKGCFIIVWGPLD